MAFYPNEPSGSNTMHVPHDETDARVRLMEQFVSIEARKAEAEMAAKEASASAAEISDAFARVRAELHEALGISEKSRAEDSVNRAARAY